MHNLSILVPPMLEEAIGYDGSARFVAFYWMPGGDECMYDDGRLSGTGNWQAYLAFVHHPRVWPELQPYNLGSSDFEADYWLLLDREEPRRLSIATPKEARQVLREQWPTDDSDLPDLTFEQWEEVAQRIAEHFNRLPSMAEVQARMDAQYRLLNAMEDWLNGHN